MGVGVLRHSHTSPASQCERECERGCECGCESLRRVPGVPTRTDDTDDIQQEAGRSPQMRVIAESSLARRTLSD